MEPIVKDEAARVNALSNWGALEYQVAGEIAAWILQQPIKFPSMEIACKAYWNERLN